MNRNSVLVIIVVLGICAGVTAFAQQARPYNVVMKDVQTTFASMRKNLDANSAAAVAEDAAKLEGFFKETEAFWTQFHTKDAMDLSKAGREAAAAAVTAAKGGDTKAAAQQYAAIQRTCGACHGEHREDTGKGFAIKP